MNRDKLIKSIVQNFTQQISNLSDPQLEKLKSGKLEIKLMSAVGTETGGTGQIGKGYRGIKS